ncbi:tRNA dihydrouridine synthase DusB [Amylibacter sp. SFDW26]|uniref:tRNA dihydrouridine synthase DusB n=1 Tax=Amylibacter sp. SFDW26 TaxID=2652722 RepID=UPI0012624BA2|nr:tRNA dihydrouridine synthase DusB [Amylibacter sp. SFDW26]KAB7615744.1 tRNA dihydrouridine synthase DusB [Amylibacter sp. SFDW26]
MTSILIENKALSPAVFLAPLAGITDLPFRNLVSEFGAGLVVSEMVASQEMVQERPSVQARAELGFESQNTSVQIAGRDAYWMAECAKMCADNGAKIIDINMGCPAKQVTNGLSGSALMKTPDFALTLIEAVVNAVDLPVTLKTRLGWDDDMLNAPHIAKQAESAGIKMVTIHGRTRCQFYKGNADWNAIRDVKDAVDIPVIANGDIVDTKSAKRALEASGADGIMVGRGAQGKPWALAQIAHDIFGTDAPSIPVGNSLIDMITRHYEEILKFYGAELGNRVARKHLGWYMDYIGTNRTLRRAVQTEKDTTVVLSLIQNLYDDTEVAA